MTHVSQFLSAENRLEVARAASRSDRRLGLATRISSMAKWIGAYIDAMADYYAAAAMYEQLHRLSDAELQRRGLSRDNLARDVHAACDRSARPD